MASPEQAKVLVDKVAAIFLEVDVIASSTEQTVDRDALLQGMMIGLHAAHNPDLNPNELFEAGHAGNVGFGNETPEQLRGLFIGALMVPYVLGEEGETDV